MNDWQPIKTAPKDGTIILLTNGILFAAGKYTFRIEDDWKFLGYDEGCVYESGPFKGSPRIGPHFGDRVPNPNAGWKHEWWDLIGVSAFEDIDCTDSGGHPQFFEPTHWMLLPAAPAHVHENSPEDKMS
jgi:hypothetical protein